MTGEEPKDTTSQRPGINGGLLPRRGPPPIDGAAVNAFVCTVEVASVDRVAENVVAAGGKIVVPKTAVPGVAWLAYARDTEGNVFGLHQHDPQAK